MENKNIGWNFPSNNYGETKGISDPGLETFAGRKLGSLAREIGQNSLDAVDNKEKPVYIEFKKMRIESKKLLGFCEFNEIISRCHTYWKNRNNLKAELFFEKAQKLLNGKEISVLRISDFNTTGLLDIQKDEGCWHSLVKSTGESNKGGEAGGSFGIGKNAPFASSDLKTVIYSSYNCNGEKGTQGVARLATFEDDKKDKKTGTGYYGRKDKNSPINELIKIDSKYNRGEEKGTDIYVIGFKEDAEWENEMTTAILEHFLLAIYDEKLVVEIGKTTIKKDNIANLLINHRKNKIYKKEMEKTFNYYKLLKSNTEIITKQISDIGEIELKILLEEGLHRKVLITRKMGMKIFEQSRYPRDIEFAGILKLKGEKINNFFREMENPQHDKWEEERHSDRKKAKAVKKELFDTIKSIVKELGYKEPLDEMDASGMSEILPDDINLVDEGNKKDEYISNDIRDYVKIEPRIKTKENKIKRKEIIINASEMELNRIGIKLGVGHIGTSITKTKGNNGGNSNKEMVLKMIGISTSRAIIMNKKNRMYKLAITSEKTLEMGVIKIFFSGENQREEVKLEDSENVNGEKNIIKGQNIYIGKIIKDEKMNIYFKLKTKEEYPLEVELYGH